jgi:hypothetical protein
LRLLPSTTEMDNSSSVDGFLAKIALITTYLPGRLQRKLPNNTLKEK